MTKHPYADVAIAAVSVQILDAPIDLRLLGKEAMRWHQRWRLDETSIRPSHRWSYPHADAELTHRETPGQGTERINGPFRWLDLLEGCPGVEVCLWRRADYDTVVETLR